MYDIISDKPLEDPNKIKPDFFIDRAVKTPFFKKFIEISNI